MIFFLRWPILDSKVDSILTVSEASKVVFEMSDFKGREALRDKECYQLMAQVFYDILEGQVGGSMLLT